MGHKHGTYDAQGVFHPQRVHLGQTMSGQYGLFTGHTLAWGLEEEKLWAFMEMSPIQRADYCTKLGFTYEPDRDQLHLRNGAIYSDE